MTDILKRLRQEKKDWENKFYKFGKVEGLTWASSAHYEDLLYVLHFRGTYQLTSEPKMAKYFKKIYQSTELAMYPNQESIQHEQMFIDGWFKGVNGFWNQIKEKI